VFDTAVSLVKVTLLSQMDLSKQFTTTQIKTLMNRTPSWVYFSGIITFLASIDKMQSNTTINIYIAKRCFYI